MQKGFWKKLKTPIMALAPMANVTDAAFRRIIAKYGKPDVMWTEFVSVDGLCSAGREALLTDLIYDKTERPIVAQIFGSKPENFYRTALLLQELGFDGIDINMGCPDRNVEKQGAGAKLMLNPELAQKIIKETMRGAGKLPVSVKTRLGYNKNILDTWLPQLLETELAAVIIHARTRKEMSLVPARWEEVARAVNIRDKYCDPKNKTLILGNGDAQSLADAKLKARESGADGVMIGRGIFGNPWFFNKDFELQNANSPLVPQTGSRSLREASSGRGGFTNVDQPTPGLEAFPAQAGTPNAVPIAERLRVMVEHTFLFEKLLGEKKNFANMKKHYKAYANGFPGAKELRIKLMEARDAGEVGEIVKVWQGNA